MEQISYKEIKDRRKFIKVFNQKGIGGVEKAMEIGELTGEAARLFLYMLTFNDNGFIYESQSDIAAKLMKRQPQIARAVKELKEAEFIQEVKRGTYRLSGRWAKYG